MSTSKAVHEAIQNFGKSFHRESLPSATGNYISSPLGAWFLLAQAAGGNPEALTEEQRSRIENSLGVTIEEAYEATNALLRGAPEAIKAAAATWVNPHVVEEPKMKKWLANTEETKAVEVTRALPTKQELDGWVKDSTLGIIESFPLEVTPDVLIVLANTIATKIAWSEPYEEVDAENLPGWGGVGKVLHSPAEKQTKYITADNSGNKFLVVKNTGSGVTVYSVISVDPNLDPMVTMKAAESMVNGGNFHPVSPAQIGEESDVCAVETLIGYGGDKYEAYLPAWSAESTHKLADMGIPYFSAASAFFEDIDLDLEAVQVAKAKYNKNGFEAAAVSALMFRAAGMPAPHEIHKVKFSFNRPYAVVATHQTPYKVSRVQGANIWDGLSIFSAWVTEADEVTDESFES